MTEPTIAPGIDWTALPERPWVAKPDADVNAPWAVVAADGRELTYLQEGEITALWAASPDLYEALADLRRTRRAPA